MVTPKQIAKVMNLIDESGLSTEEFQAFLESGEFTDLLQKFKCRVNKVIVTLNGGLSHHDVVAAGRYDWVNDTIRQQNPQDLTSSKPNGSADPYRGSQEVELHLVPIDRDMTTEQVCQELDKRGLRAATFRELCALGAAHPELQRQFPIVALGSGWRRSVGGVNVPVLGGNGRTRSLDLFWGNPSNRWSGHYRFLAVSK